MKKRIVFEFNENSLIELGECEIEATVIIGDHVIILPKSRGIIECAPTKRAVDVCLVCRGEKGGYDKWNTWHACPECGGTGTSR